MGRPSHRRSALSIFLAADRISRDSEESHVRFVRNGRLFVATLTGIVLQALATTFLFNPWNWPSVPVPVPVGLMSIILLLLGPIPLSTALFTKTLREGAIVGGFAFPIGLEIAGSLSVPKVQSGPFYVPELIFPLLLLIGLFGALDGAIGGWLGGRWASWKARRGHSQPDNQTGPNEVQGPPR